LFKVIIADDDSGMRMILKKVLKRHEDFKLVGEAKDGEEVIRKVEEIKPDLVFMDIDMPNLSGIDAAKLIHDINPKIKIIFATAHEQYMGEAFELYAYDYLLKPFKIKRIEQSLNRIVEIKDGLISTEDNIPKKKTLSKLVIKNKNGINFIDLDEIIFIQRENRQTVIYSKNEIYKTSESLSDIEERLNKSKFLRSHKSYIINITLIKKIELYGRWTYIVKFKDFDKDALLTNSKYETLENLL
jgi:two-component system LytT family response regulator